RSGLLQRIKDALKEEELFFTELSGVRPNPRLALAEEGVKKGIAERVDFILAAGGGSAIDTAKAVAHGIANPNVTLWDIWTKKVRLEESLQVGVMLTVAAAGSEPRHSAVRTHAALGKEMGRVGELDRPALDIRHP